jgi:CheY-like chemotaxis protein
MRREPERIDSTPQVDLAAPAVLKAKALGLRCHTRLPLVLIVDDDHDARAIHAEILRHRGFRTSNAEDGEACIRMAVAATPDVILMDGSMPGMSGFETAQQLKSDARTRAIPIVMLTGFARPTRTSESSPSCDAYITKPSTADDIAATLRSVLIVAQRTHMC